MDLSYNPNKDNMDFAVFLRVIDLMIKLNENRYVFDIKNKLSLR